MHQWYLIFSQSSPGGGNDWLKLRYKMKKFRWSNLWGIISGLFILAILFQGRLFYRQRSNELDAPVLNRPSMASPVSSHKVVVVNKETSISDVTPRFSSFQSISEKASSISDNSTTHSNANHEQMNVVGLLKTEEELLSEKIQGSN